MGLARHDGGAHDKRCSGQFGVRFSRVFIAVNLQTSDDISAAV